MGMGHDRYKQKLSDAQWTWRETRGTGGRRKYDYKDRVMGRNNKRAARQADRREFEKQVLTAAERRLAEAELQADEA